MALFGKKRPPKDETPLGQVVSMRNQGMDNNRIIQTLQRDGYSSSQIFEAMNQADRPEANVPSAESTEDSNPMPSEEQQSAQKQELEQEEPAFNPQPNYSQTAFRQPQERPTNIPQYQEKSPETEELIESIIDEKWKDFAKDINKVVDWKNRTEQKINLMEQEFSDLKTSFDKLHQAILGKIGEYDKNILNVGAEVKAMEKVFSKVLPVFTEKVNDLSKVADAMKKKSKK
ncbi:MAG: hypothetical protein ABH828_05565 [archaeon]